MYLTDYLHMSNKRFEKQQREYLMKEGLQVFIKDKIGNKEYNKGKITITSRLNENFAEIKVIDDGMGIPEEIHPKPR